MNTECTAGKALLIVFACLLAVSIVWPGAAKAQDLEGEHDFVRALALMSAQDDLMNGVLQPGDLQAIRSVTKDHYQDYIDNIKNNRDADPDSNNANNWAYVIQSFEKDRDYVLNQIDKKIQQQQDEKNEFLHVFLTMLTSNKIQQSYSDEDHDAMLRGQALSDNDPGATNRALDDYQTDLRDTMVGGMISDMLTLHVVKNDPETASLLQTLPDNAYDFTAVGITPPPLAGDDGSTSIVDDTPSLGDSSADIDTGDGGSSSGGGGDGDGSPPAEAVIQKKPIRFENSGFEAVTVRTYTYKPEEGYPLSLPTASTVVFPEGSSSASLELPLGTYTFCYDWDLGDVDGDGETEYHHKITGEKSLKPNSPNDVGKAILVTLSPDSSVSNPNGNCAGEGGGAVGELPPQDGLTPEERANQGTHYYVNTCSGVVFSTDCSDDGSEYLDVTFNFGNNSLVVNSSDSDGPQTLTRIGENTYQQIDDGSTLVMTIRLDGFDYHWVDSEWATDAVLHFRFAE